MNTTYPGGRTALMFAAANNSGSCIPVLVEAGADVNAVDRRGYSALAIAEQYHSQTVIKQLKEASVKMFLKAAGSGGPGNGFLR